MPRPVTPTRLPTSPETESMRDLPMHTTRTPARSRIPVRAAATLLALAAVLTPAAAWADDTNPPVDPNLNQVIDPNEPIVHGDQVITTGHVDMGPKFDGTTWKFLINDDARKADANAQSVWRYPQETVLQLGDSAKLTVPEGDTYSFVGADPGATVWVVPQTQNPDVVWAGWNTQDPTVMSKIDRGATFSVDGVQGPGVMTVYLQSGDFGAPEVLWDSRKTGAQQVFVDTNTHTHANWVFTKPGVYLVQMTAAATLIDGSTVSDTELLRFAVGAGTSADDALNAAWTGSAPSSSPAPSSPAPAVPLAGDSDGTGQGPLVTILIVVIAIVAAGLIAGFAIVIVRGNRAKKKVLAARTTPRTDTDSGRDGNNDDGDAA